MNYEYIIPTALGQSSVIIINTLPLPSNPPNTPEEISKQDEILSLKELNKEDPKNNKSNDQTPNLASNIQLIIVIPTPQYFFVPT